MIIKGASRADGGQLAAYLMKKGDNGRVELLEMRNMGGRDLRAGLRMAEVEAEQSNGKKPLYHAQIAPAEGETMTRQQQMMAVEILEKRLGFKDLPRVVVLHEKDGREHLHVAWSRYDRETGTLRRDSFTKMKHVAAAMEIALRFGFDLLRNPFTSQPDAPELSRAERRQQSKEQDTHAERQQDERSAERRDERKAWITEIWNSSDSAKAFRGALEDTGYTLAYGKRGFVVVDEKGEIHSLARQIDGATAKDIRARLSEIDSASIPQADEIQAGIRQARKDRAREIAQGAIERAAAAGAGAGTDAEQSETPHISGGAEVAAPSLDPIQRPSQEVKESAAESKPTAESTAAAAEPEKPKTAAEILADLTRHHSTFTRQDLARMVDKETGGGGVEPWMMRKGGLESLDDDAKLSAERSYAKWAEDNEALAAKFGFVKYVSYVQARQAERDAADPDALKARQDSKAAFDKLLAEVEALPDLIQLGADARGRDRYTSRDMLQTELRMKTAGEILASRDGHAVPVPLRDAVPGIDTLGDEQRAAFEYITGAGDLALVVGYAGTGKSHMLGLAREAWEAAGLRVRGAALSGIAAEGLQEGSGIQSRTLHGLLHQLDTIGEREAAIADVDHQLDALRSADGPTKDHTRGNKRERAYLAAKRANMAADLEATRLTDRDVIVLDEAAMVGSRELAKLLDAAQRAGAKVVMTGDQEQLQSVEAGAGFRAMYQQHGGQEITQVRRQRAEWMREATERFGRTEPAEALGLYRDAGNMHQVETRDQAKADLVAAWTAGRAADPEKTQIILAYLRADVAELNSLARDAYRAEGRLGIDMTLETATGKQDFATGDRLYFTKNDSKLAVKNGSLGTIQDIWDGRVTVALDVGHTVEFGIEEYGNIAHGYAATVHKTQGVTVDRAHVLASRHMDRHAAYVGMTRHRDQVDMYFGKDEFKTADSLINRLSRDGSKDTTLDYLNRAADGAASGSLRDAVADFYRRERPDMPAPAWTEQQDRPGERLQKKVETMAVRPDSKPAPAPEPTATKRKVEAMEERPQPKPAPAPAPAPEPTAAKKKVETMAVRPDSKPAPAPEPTAAKKPDTMPPLSARMEAIVARMDAEQRAAFEANRRQQHEAAEKLRRDLELKRTMGGPGI